MNSSVYGGASVIVTTYGVSNPPVEIVSVDLTCLFPKANMLSKNKLALLVIWTIPAKENIGALNILPRGSLGILYG